MPNPWPSDPTALALDTGSLFKTVTSVCLCGIRAAFSEDTTFFNAVEPTSARGCLLRENHEVGILELLGVADVTENFRDNPEVPFSFCSSASDRLAEYVPREAIVAAGLARQ